MSLDWNAIILAGVPSIGLIVVAWLNNRNNKKTHDSLDVISGRNKAVSETRIQQETAQAMVYDAMLDLLTTLIWTLHREQHIGNGELESKMDALVRARDDQKQVLQNTHQRLKSL